MAALLQNEIQTEAAIRICDLKKTFHHNIRYSRSLKELVVQSLTFKRAEGQDTEALKGISFDIYPGESVGIIGSNGSGKTTLLNMIAGVTPITDGSIETSGRVCCLTDLWAGFHIDLSGMENIFLCCTLYGLKRSDVFPILDDIQEFAGLDDFIYTPVKHYSSGMLIRLAFSIAVHLDPEVLLLDEILAVGDAVFQQRAQERVMQMKEKGITIVYVSHLLDQVEIICDRIIWLEKGTIRMDDSTANVLLGYRSEDENIFHSKPKTEYDVGIASASNHMRLGSGKMTFKNIRILDSNHKESTRFEEGDKIIIEMEIENHEQVDDPSELTIMFIRTDALNAAFYHSSRFGYTFDSTTVPKKVCVEMDAIVGAGAYHLTCGIGPLEPRYIELYDLCIRFKKFRVHAKKLHKYPVLNCFEHQATWE